MADNVAKIVTKEFTNRVRGNIEKFETVSDCPKCQKPMPILYSYTGPICSWSYGGCGHIPDGSTYRFAEHRQN